MPVIFRYISLLKTICRTCWLWVGRNWRLSDSNLRILTNQSYLLPVATQVFQVWNAESLKEGIGGGMVWFQRCRSNYLIYRSSSVKDLWHILTTTDTGSDGLHVLSQLITFLLSTLAWDPTAALICTGYDQWSILASNPRQRCEDGNAWARHGLAEGWVTMLWHGDWDGRTQIWDARSWAWKLLTLLWAVGGCGWKELWGRMVGLSLCLLSCSGGNTSAPWCARA